MRVGGVEGREGWGRRLSESGWSRREGGAGEGE